jgi:hypothetical protein
VTTDIHVELIDVWRDGPGAVPRALQLEEFQMHWHALADRSEKGRDWWPFREYWAWRGWGAPEGIEEGDEFGPLTVTSVERTADGRLAAYAWATDDGRDGEVSL